MEPTDGDRRVRVLRDTVETNVLRIFLEAWQAGDSGVWGWYIVDFQRVRVEEAVVPLLIEALGNDKLVLLSRVLEIVEKRVNMWGAMLSDARTGGPAMGHTEAATILRLLHEEFEPG